MAKSLRHQLLQLLNGRRRPGTNEALAAPAVRKKDLGQITEVRFGCRIATFEKQHRDDSKCQGFQIQIQTESILS